MVKPEERHWLSSIRTSGSYAGLGWQIGGTLVMPVLIGMGLDWWLGTTPWLLLGGALMGVIGIFALLFRVNAEMSAASRRKGAVKPPPNAPENGP